MNRPNQDRINKLPVWAREYVRDLERQAEAARRQLTEYVEGRQDGKIVLSDIVCDSSTPRCVEHRIAAERVSIEHAGVWLSINAYDKEHIDLSWGSGSSISCMGDACFIPRAYQQARLVHPSNTRPGLLR